MNTVIRTSLHQLKTNATACVDISHVNITKRVHTTRASIPKHGIGNVCSWYSKCLEHLALMWTLGVQVPQINATAHAQCTINISNVMFETKYLGVSNVHYLWVFPSVISVTKIHHVINKCIADSPDSKDHGANIGPTWGQQAPGGPNVGPMNLAIRI